MSIAQACEITIDDLHDAYRLCRLRKIGIGFDKAMNTPAILVGMRGTALARKLKKISTAKPSEASPQQSLELETV